MVATVAEESAWVPQGIDTTKASVARVYDWWLGGVHNFRVDQDAARALISVDPTTRTAIRSYRAFLIRAVRYLAAEAGIRQFLDIGSGIPTEQNVHQVAQEAAPGSRVVYVDNDEVAAAHSRAILAGNPDATVILADLRDPEAILAHPETRRMLDFSQPVGLILAAVLHVVPDSDDPDRAIAVLREPLVPGSHIVISHGCRDARPEMADIFASAYSSRVAASASFRTREEIARFFKGSDLIEPGLVWAHEWRPDPGDDMPDPSSALRGVAGVGRYPG
jgi:hypothetical protein